MKKILCPTDFSETAQSAIAYAAKLAQAMQAELTLLNVQSLFDLTPVEVLRGKDMAIAGAAERLESQSRQVSKAFKISCYADVEASNINLSSVIAGKGKDYDLIVMGSDGPDDLYQFFGGSNTYHAIVKTETPILVIPAGYLYSQINHIAYAFDYLHEGEIPLTGLIPFVRTMKSQLTILQVLAGEYSRTEEAHMQEEREKIGQLYGEALTIRFDTVSSTEMIPQSINSYMMRKQPDALALCTRHRTLLGRLFHKSTVKNLTAFSSYPVYVFHH